MITIEQEKEIIRRYKTKAPYPQTLTEIGEKFGVNSTTIRNIIIFRGYKTRPKGRVPNPYLNHYAFENVENNVEAAYWTGFLMMDGGIIKKTVKLQLDKESKPHIEKFQEFLGSNYTIGDISASLLGKIYFSSQISINSSQIVDDLAKYGVVQNKTKRVIADEKLIDNPHFWRGIINADGSINKKKNLQLSAQSSDIVQQFSDFVQRHNPEGKDHFQYNGNVWKEKNREYYQTQLGKIATVYIIKILGYNDLSLVALDKNRKKALGILHQE